MASRQADAFQTAVAKRIAALPPKLTGYVTLAGIALGTVLYASFGPNDVWTGLIVGAVFGGIAGGLIIRIFMMGLEALATRRVELAVIVCGVALVLAIWYMAR